MKKLHPLLIGMPLNYKLVDFELLKKNTIEPILTYPEGTEPIAPGRHLFYNTLTVDAIEEILKSHQVDAIVCFNDNFLMETAQLRTNYSLPGIGYPSIKKYKVKSEMYRVLHSFVRVPSTLDYNEMLTFEQLSTHLGNGEYFIKPDSLAGAEGGIHISNANAYTHWKATAFNPKIRYIVQNFYSGPLLHCELIVRNGVVTYIQARRYSYPNHTFLAGKIIASFPIINPFFRKKVEQEATKVQQILEFKNGVMHTEFFLTEDNHLVFLETNIRQAGGAINLVHKRRAGISLETAMVLLELDKEVSIARSYDNLYDFCGYIPLKQGCVSKIHIPKLKGQYTFDFKVEIGKHYTPPLSASNAAAAFIGSSPLYRDLTEDFFTLENSDIIEYN